ncbi:MAG: rRNA pseudouridine synthase [Candidatus Marinimicrobia bacterium]|nr:rRNA pseudouridine synthase [Candidatus Neomarinimicrobiota bacterium]
MRLNKYLALSGVASRRKADELIRSGAVRINGQVVKELGTQLAGDEVVEVAGRAVEPEGGLVYYLLHKPAGVISSAADERGRTTVVDLIRERRRIFPVGRLDRDTTGAMIITNDGKLTLRLTHPRYEVRKEYLAEVKGRLSAKAVAELARGVEVDERMTVRADLKKVAAQGKKTVYRLVLTEGKNREIKRIFRHYDLPLLRLHRTLFAGLTADDMAPGKYRRLTKGEVATLFGLAEMNV